MALACGSPAALGPDEPDPAVARDIVGGLVEALRHLRQRRAAGLGLITIGPIGSSTASSRWRHPGLPQLLPRADRREAGHRRPRHPGRLHRGRVRGRGRGHPSGERRGAYGGWSRGCSSLGGLPARARRDLRQGAAAGRRLPARAHRPVRQDLRRHPRPGPRRRRVQGPGVRPLRHDLQRRPGRRRRDRGRDRAGERQVGADPRRAGRRYSWSGSGSPWSAAACRWTKAPSHCAAGCPPRTPSQVPDVHSARVQARAQSPPAPLRAGSSTRGVGIRCPGPKPQDSRAAHQVRRASSARSGPSCPSSIGSSSRNR